MVEFGSLWDDVAPPINRLIVLRIALVCFPEGLKKAKPGIDNGLRLILGFLAVFGGITVVK